MGAIADKKFNLYGSGEGQIDIAKQMRLSGYVNPKDQITTAIVSSLPSIFMSLTQKVVDFSVDCSSENNNGELGEAGTAIQEEINTILTKHGCSSIQDLSAKFDNTAAEVQEQRKIYDDNHTIVVNNTAGLEHLNGQYTSLVEEIKNINNEINNPQITPEQKNAKFNELIAKQERLKSVEEQRAKCEEELIDAQEKVDQASAIIEPCDALLKDIEIVNNLVKRLKTLDGKDGRRTIDELTNDDTKNIAELIQDLHKNPKNSEQLEKQLMNALEKYAKNHEKGDNPTYDKLLEKYNIEYK